MGDITTIATDAMVNTAHFSLQAGSGLCRVIHQKGGKLLQDDCKQLLEDLGHLSDSEVTVSVAGDLPAINVIHAVSPRWLGGDRNEEQLLLDTYTNILLKADEIQAKTLSIPPLATGIHGFPKQRAAKIAMQAIINTLPNLTHTDKILLVNSDTKNSFIYKIIFNTYASKIKNLQLETLLPGDFK